MADLFELVEPNVVLKIRGKEYKIHDPKHIEKISLHKEQDELISKKNELPLWEYSEKTDQLNKKMIKLYLKDMTKAELESLGENSQNAVLEKIYELLPTKFGATVKKDDEKK